jgi:hypothetical protein
VSELYLLASLLVIANASMLCQQWMHRKDLRDAADGIASFLKGENQATWLRAQREIESLRGELQKAQDRLIHLRRPVNHPSHSPPLPFPGSAPRASSPPRRKDMEHATMGGI